MLTRRAILYDESALDLVVFNGLHQPGNCNNTLSEGENPLVVLLLFIQSNSSFKSKLKHAYLIDFQLLSSFPSFTLFGAHSGRVLP